jgi:hypothetical protein
MRRPEAIVTFVVVVACTVFVFVQLEPSQLLRETTPAGGDMGAHVWLPAFIKRVLIPDGRLFGWSMDWYAGFPALSFFFPLPMVAIAVFSYVVPYDIAFKLVSVSGLVALPAACWAFGRLSKMRFPGPACLAAASVPFLFGREFTIYGGNIASTMAGEFGFSISLAFGILFLGLMARVLRTGKGKALCALVLVCCALSHILPLFFVIVGAGVMVFMDFSWTRLRAALAVGVVAGLLIAFWALPYVELLPYATNMGYQRITTYLHSLFPTGQIWLVLLAGVGAALALVRRNRTGSFLLVMAVLSALAFRLSPTARLWNARWLPFWFLCLYLLAGVAFAEAGALLAESDAWRRLVRSVPGRPSRGVMAVPVVTLLAALVWTGFPLRILPLGHTTASGRYDWLGITSSDNSYIPDWVHWNYSGYQSADKPSRTAYFALIAEMEHLGRTDGCGRAMYEYEPAINDMGTPDALMLLPYWTKGCIASMEGLYYESSATTPFHFLNVSELSETPSDPMVGLDYATTPDVPEGIEHLQMFGVKYFMAVSPEVKTQAGADPSLTLLAKVGPYPTEVTNAAGTSTTVQQQTWNIYEVHDSPLVEPLANQPVVMEHVGGIRWMGHYMTASGQPTPQDSPAESWYLDPSRWDVYETASGPSSWARVPALDPDPPLRPEPATTVSDIHLGEESVSFHVSRIGVPVLVKVSYFPNWQVQGASAIYRATPNLMVVVPTSKHVVLTYGRTLGDWIGGALTLVGLLGLLLLWRRPARLARAGSPTGGWSLPGRPRRAQPLAHAVAGPSAAGSGSDDPFWSATAPRHSEERPWYHGESPVGSPADGAAAGSGPPGDGAGPLINASGPPGDGAGAGSGRPGEAPAGPEGLRGPETTEAKAALPPGSAGVLPYRVPPPPPPEDPPVWAAPD